MTTGLLCRLGSGERFFVGKDRFVIGRGSRCDLAVFDGNVSRAHTVITRVDGTWWVSDLKSTSGTRIGGQRIRGRVQLQIGRRVELGDTQFTVVDLAYTPAPGEFTAPIARTLVFEAPGCRVEANIASITGNDELAGDLASVLAQLPGTLEGDLVRSPDPVDAIRGARQLEHALREMVAEIEVRFRRSTTLIGPTAVERLAADDASWQWLTASGRLPELRDVALRGFAFDLPSPRAAGVPPPELVSAGSGLVIWLEDPVCGALIEIDREIAIGEADDDDINIRGFRFAPVHTRIGKREGRWAIEIVPSFGGERVSKLLEVGVMFDLDGWSLRVVAI